MAKSYSTTYHDTLKPNLKSSARKQLNVVKYSREYGKLFQHETPGYTLTYANIENQKTALLSAL